MSLEIYRKKIDKIDREIFGLLAERFKVVKLVGEFKKKHSLPIRNKEREKKMVEDKIKRFRIDKEFISRFYKLIFNTAYKLEKYDGKKEGKK